MKEPETLEGLCDYIVQYADNIYVRAEVDGEWDAYSLAELPGDQAVKFALRFIKERRIPVRVRTDEEINAEKEATKEGA